jgi:hypothetical protein
VSQVYGYSFILTDMVGDATEIELWQRQRAHIEERIKDAKLGCGLIHLPRGTLRANRAWQAAAVIAVNLVAMLSAILLDTLPKPPVSDDAPVLDDDVAVDNDEPSHRLATTVRRWMIAAPGRLSRKRPPAPAPPTSGLALGRPDHRRLRPASSDPAGYLTATLPRAHRLRSASACRATAPKPRMPDGITDNHRPEARRAVSSRPSWRQHPSRTSRRSTTLVSAPAPTLTHRSRSDVTLAGEAAPAPTQPAAARRRAPA